MDLTDAIKAHSEWKRKLRGAIAAQSSLDATSIAKDNCCALGKWLHGEGMASFGSMASLANCVIRHAAFHVEAGKVAQLINGRKFEEAQTMLGSGTAYTTASNEVLFAIGALKPEAKL